jgi:MYXO-CTERM domain-containing protein
MYEGPSEHFAWLLPVPGEPTVGVSSDQALASLKQLTNPNYQLQTVFDDSCNNNGGFANTPGVAMGGTSAGSGGSFAPGNPGVTVVASGAVGPYDYEVIHVDASLDDKAQVAVDWLTTNKYDIGDIGADVLRPYLDEGLNLLAIRLQKGTTSGSIRPIIVTYDSELPSIPIRPTAVAANDDMGVMVWVLDKDRAIPSSYKALELNEALIDWFNPNNNYNDVVSRAADEAMGQGFVTEYAGKVSDLKNIGLMIFNEGQRQQWDTFSNTQFTDAIDIVLQARQMWGGFDGFEDAMRETAVLPDEISYSDFKNCMRCFIDEPGVVFDTSLYLQNLYKMVIKPLIDTQDIIDSRPYITRMYTTMSADEMTMDPTFDFNADLEDVSNFHTAERHVGCDVSGPWTVEFPQGIVRGTELGVWPVAIDDQPAALKILQYAKTGQGKVVEDRTEDILKLLAKNGTPTKPNTGTGGTGGSTSKPGTGGSGASGSGGSGAGGNGGIGGSGIKPGTKGTAGMGGGDDVGMKADQMDDGGCSVSGTQPAPAIAWMLLAVGALLARRRSPA